ncbi:MAG: hypothetical protein Q9187_008242 [Circinaria calcarea]
MAAAQDLISLPTKFSFDKPTNDGKIVMHWNMPRTPEGMYDNAEAMTNAETVAMALERSRADLDWLEDSEPVLPINLGVQLDPSRAVSFRSSMTTVVLCFLSDSTRLDWEKT